MRNILLAVLVTLLPPSIAAAEPFRLPKDKAVMSGSPAPAKPKVGSCSAYGAGFAKIDGSDTCVKVGGAVMVGVGGGSH